MRDNVDFVMETIKAQVFFCKEYLEDHKKPAEFYFDYLSARVYTDNDVFVITPDTTNEELKNKMDEAIK
mgnify:CR=1 FL=1